MAILRAPAPPATRTTGEERRTALRRIGVSAVVLVLGLGVILLDRSGDAGTSTPTAEQEWRPSAGAGTGAGPDAGSGVGGSSPSGPDDGSSGTRLTGDLGLATPISSPPCAGGLAVFVGAAVDPSSYVSDVQRFLAAHPGSEYLLASASCSSLARTSGGNDIYAVYYGPFPSLQEACAQQRRTGGDSYLRRLDDVTPVGRHVPCR